MNLGDHPTVRHLPEQVKGGENRQHRLNRTRLSLLYLGSYLFIIGIGLLFAPRETLKILQSNGDYGDVFPRVVGMLMSGLGLSTFGIIRACTSELYPRLCSSASTSLPASASFRR